MDGFTPTILNYVNKLTHTTYCDFVCFVVILCY